MASLLSPGSLASGCPAGSPENEVEHFVTRLTRGAVSLTSISPVVRDTAFRERSWSLRPEDDDAVTICGSAAMDGVDPAACGDLVDSLG
jgi:hypothetical protein